MTMNKNEKQKIFTNQETAFLTDMLKKSFGPLNSKYAESKGINFENNVNFLSVSTNCQSEREKRNLTIKDIAAKLKAPQYKLKYIEDNDVNNTEPLILQKYINFLELDEWFDEWLKSNPKLAAKFKIG